MGRISEYPASLGELKRLAPEISRWFEDIALPSLDLLVGELNERSSSEANAPSLYLKYSNPWPYFLAVSFDYLPDDERPIRYPIQIEKATYYIQVLENHQIMALRHMFEVVSTTPFAGRTIKLSPPIISLETELGDPLTYTRQFMPTFSDWN